jgi:hypothetical protein
MEKVRDELFRAIYVLPDDGGRVFQNISFEEEIISGEDIAFVIDMAFGVVGNEGHYSFFSINNWEEKLCDLVQSLRYNGASILKAVECISGLFFEHRIQFEQFVRYCRDSKRIEQPIIKELEAHPFFSPQKNVKLFPENAEQLDDWSFFTEFFVHGQFDFGPMGVFVRLTDKRFSNLNVWDFRYLFRDAFANCVFPQQLDEVLEDYYGEQGAFFFEYLEACVKLEPVAPLVKELLRRRDEYRNRKNKC